MTAYDSEEAIQAWRAGTLGRACLLVTDDSADDGLNLQSADAAVHLRLPWTPNKLEQRLGRVDRFPGAEHAAMRNPAEQYVALPASHEECVSAAWLALLRDGYHIFDESVSTLQDAIALGLPSVWAAAIAEGPAGLESATKDIRDALEVAAVEIDKMDMLESIHERAAKSVDIATAMGELEADWREIRNAVLGYTSQTGGGIGIRHFERGLEGRTLDVFDVGGSNPLVDPRILRVAEGMYGEGSAEGFFNRTTALQMPGHRIFRAGNPLVELLSNVVQNDDRGQATCAWRLDANHIGDPEIFLGFDFLIEVDLEAAESVVPPRPAAMKAVRRQADYMFPPFMLKVWIAVTSGIPVTARRQVQWLDLVYDNRRDQNMTGEMFAAFVNQLGGWSGFRNLGEEAEGIARTHLVQTPEFADRCDRAVNTARENLRIVRAQTRARIAAGRLVNDDESMVLNDRVTAALINGIANPITRVVAASCLGRKGRERAG
jgi:ATP-dependent helicase HepA